MPRKKLFVFIAGCALLINSCSNQTDASQPNVILIMADDMGYECLGAYGSTSYQTPNLDKIADEHILVSHCISNPLCTPSRVRIMTGKYNYRNYEHFGYLNPKERTFGHVMQDAGYKTCIVGKWQLNGIYHDLPENQDLERPHELGFDEYCLWQLNSQKSKGERFANPLIVENGVELERDPEAYGPEIFADYALDFIERNQEERFFLYYPMVLVHDPFVPTPDSDAWKDPDRRYENNNAYFADMVAYADKITGKIDRKLTELGIADHTLLIFTGDNGTNRALVSYIDSMQIRGAKGMTIDHGVHVPLVMKWPAKKAHSMHYDGIIGFSDFFATFADIVNDTSTHDGMSFLDIFEEEDFHGRTFNYTYYDPDWGEWVNQYRNVYVQDQRFKLYQDGRMFDINIDLLEEKPLDGKKMEEHGQIRKILQKELEKGPQMK